MPAVLSPKLLGATVLLTGLGVGLSGEVFSRERSIQGKAQRIGAGTLQSFVRTDRSGLPLAVGVTFSAGALEQLPATPNTTSRCFDANGDGRYTTHECMGDEERILELPRTADSLPFGWIMVNWNPGGHHAPYATPHFDFHFYLSDRALVESIRPGRCGEMVDCEDFKRGSRRVPARYVPAGYIDVGAVAPRMGNHLLDSQSPELKDSLPFTSTFIYGAYDGDVIFMEPMITLDVLQNAGNTCLDIRQPRAFQRAGYYPTQYCIRQNHTGGPTVSLEGFRHADGM